MRGLSNQAKTVIGQIVDRLFDKMGHSLLGNIPAFKNKKTILFSSNPLTTLAHLFLMGLGQSHTLPKEEEALKNMLDTAHGYLESLRERTKARLSESVNSYVAEARLRNQTPSASAIRERVTESLEKAKSDIKRISEAEATKARNMGKLMSIARVGAALGTPDPNVFFVLVKDSHTCDECKRLHLHDDGITPRVWKMSELGFSYHHKGEHNPKVCGLHPHCRCLYDKYAPVITERGVISICNIEVGDKVLTHTGEFKRVTATFGKKGINPNPEDPMFRIEYEDPFGKIRKLRTTGDHQLLTQDGWVSVEKIDLKKHQLQFLHKKCEECDNIFPYDINHSDKRFCSIKCVGANNLKTGICANRIGNKQSKEEIEKRSLSVSITANRKHEESGKRSSEKRSCFFCQKEFIFQKSYFGKSRRTYRKGGKFCSKKCSSKNSALNQWKSSEHRKNISKKTREKLLEQYRNGIRLPESVEKARKVLYRMGRGPSKDQKKLFEYIKEHYEDAVLELRIGKYYADIAIPSVKTIIEWDGAGHWLEVFKGKISKEEKIKKDQLRDQFLSEQGWHVLRYDPSFDKNKVLPDIRRVALNSTKGYSFKSVKIKRIVKVNPCLRSKKAKLFDLTVEDNHSFVVMGIVSHNCTLTLLSPGFGFKNGIVSFVSPDHDEYKRQRGSE